MACLQAPRRGELLIRDLFFVINENSFGRSSGTRSPRLGACRHAMHSYSTAYVKFLRSVQYCRSVQSVDLYSTVDLLYRGSCGDQTGL